IYAALVVLLGYTNTFTRTNQWQNQARYEVGPGLVCGFPQTSGREGQMEVVHYYSRNVQESTRLLFQGLFESFLQIRRVAATRYQPVSCPKCGYRQERVEVVKRLTDGQKFLFCSNCGKKITLTPAAAAAPL